MILLKRRGLVSYYQEGDYDPIIKKGVISYFKEGVMILL